LEPKPKDHRQVPIQADLRESLRETFDLIQQAERDPDIMLDHGDAIQVGRVRRTVWQAIASLCADLLSLTLDHTEIEGTGDGRIEQIRLRRCTSPDCRCKFREPNDHCFY